MSCRRVPLVISLIAAALAPAVCGAAEGHAPYFAIEVVDADTGRGVPLVELRTVNEMRYVTDSAGLVAFNEPGLMDRDVYFFISSHGYEYPKDGFGFRGKALRTTPGGSARITMKRLNIAERLYRVTGQGIYHDSVMLGRRPPLANPVLSGRVLGQDSCFAMPYRDRIYWFWGDTNRESYPLGQFAMYGATSALPGRGGLEPSVGVDLEYFVDKDGFSRKMAPLEGPGMVWLDGFVTTPDETGRIRLAAHYGRMKSLAERQEHGLMAFNDEKAVFEVVLRMDDKNRLHPKGQATRITSGGQAYWYFCYPMPLVRVKDGWKYFIDPAAYESYTCLAPGSAFDAAAPRLERDSQGRLVWGWKAGTADIDPGRERELLKAGHMKPDEARFDIRDAATGKRVLPHAGSVRWNEYRRRWIMIFCENFGSSLLGETWYAEAEKPEGPWRKARKIVTHDDYSFYNPVQHAFFDQDGGRIIHFEGTYTRTFSGAKIPTPRYDYNQVMYRMDLSDPRLKME